MLHVINPTHKNISSQMIFLTEENPELFKIYLMLSNQIVKDNFKITGKL